MSLKHSVSRTTANMMAALNNKNITSTASLLKNVESQQSLNGLPTMNTVGSNAQLLTNNESMARLSPALGKSNALGSMPHIHVFETIGGANEPINSQMATLVPNAGLD